MAKTTTKATTPSPTYAIPPSEITAEWIEKNRAAFEALGYPLVTKEEFDRKIAKEDAAAQAAKDLLGLDLEASRQVDDVNRKEHELWDFLTRVKKQLDLLVNSTQYHSKVSWKEKLGLHFVRVFLRQIFNEKPPVGQAASLRELIADQSGLQDGVLNDRVRMPKEEVKKRIHLTKEHLVAAGVLDGN